MVGCCCPRCHVETNPTNVWVHHVVSTRVLAFALSAHRLIIQQLLILHVGAKLSDPCFKLVVVQTNICQHTTQGTRRSIQPAQRYTRRLLSIDGPGPRHMVTCRSTARSACQTKRPSLFWAAVFKRSQTRTPSLGTTQLVQPPCVWQQPDPRGQQQHEVGTQRHRLVLGAALSVLAHHSFVWKPMSLPLRFVVCLNPSGLSGFAYVYLDNTANSNTHSISTVHVTVTASVCCCQHPSTAHCMHCHIHCAASCCLASDPVAESFRTWQCRR